MAETKPPSGPDPAVVVAEKLNADIVLFNQSITQSSADGLRTRLDKIEHPNENVFVVLVTSGGDAHAAYIIARDLQTRYKKVILCISGDCYSAGTLIVLCAHELVIADRGRLGPLDVQVQKKDELFEQLSGLTVGAALEELGKKASESLLAMALELSKETGWQMSFKTALEVSANITSAMYGEIFRQIDPVRLGEDAMLLKVAAHYGTMLGRKSRNLKEGTVERLSSGYPAHECIIDREEAESLFVNVRRPDSEEKAFLGSLGPAAIDYRVGRNDAKFIFVVPTNIAGDSDGKKTDNPIKGDATPSDGGKAKSGIPSRTNGQNGKPGEGDTAAGATKAEGS